MSALQSKVDAANAVFEFVRANSGTQIAAIAREMGINGNTVKGYMHVLRCARKITPSHSIPGKTMFWHVVPGATQLDAVAVKPKKAAADRTPVQSGQRAVPRDPYALPAAFFAESAA